MEQNRRTKLVDQTPGRPDYSHAIETAYRNYLFRSRLEAKYAAFFDLCGWPWSYEPKDFNGWIPDFALGETATLVEIKPFFHAGEWNSTRQKILESGCRQPVILLGADPTWNSDRRITGSDYHFGELIEAYDRDGQIFSTRDELHFGVTEGNNKPGLCAMWNAWWNPIWNLTGKPARVELDYKTCEEILVARWAKAHNASRWMKVKHED